MNNQIIFLIILYILIINYVIIEIYINDIYLILKRQFFYSYSVNNNLISNSENKKEENTSNIKILIISFDNRKNFKFIDLHNKNIMNYCELWKNVEYEFADIDNCNESVYWYKLILMYEKLNSNKYDYVMWMDSDTIIAKQDMSLQKLVNSYLSDIFISYNNGIFQKNILCAGVFIIKNSDIGKNFVKDCIDLYKKSNCKKSNNKLNGIYGHMCYEEGVMNYFIYEKYFKYTTVLEPNIINNIDSCNKDSFILHYYGLSNDELVGCFQ
jgi:hypothetical protein